MPVSAIVALALGTLVFRLAGPVLGYRLRLSERFERLAAQAAIMLLVALVATTALADGRDLVGWARPVGVASAGVLALMRCPFPVVVIAAAGTTAALRWLGVP
jgi:branched-subunit amino acid transport protein